MSEHRDVEKPAKKAMMGNSSLYNFLRVAGMRQGGAAVALVLMTSLLGACAITHTSKSQYPDGQRKVVHEYKFRDEREVRHGEYREWYENGQLKVRGTYHDGEREGLWEFWRANGEPIRKGSFSGESRDGQWTFFHGNGQRRSTGHYEEGRRVGRWSFWDDRGTLHAHGTYPASADADVVREFVGDAPEKQSTKSEKSQGVFCEKEHLSAVVSAFNPEFTFCYEKELQDSPSLSGQVDVQWMIGLRGEVEFSSIDQSTLENRAVEECILNVVAMMQFDPPDGGTCLINYPFRFNPAAE